MKPVKFNGSNVVYAENQKEYLPLPAYKTPEGDVTSCWKLTWKERIKMFFTGKIYFTIMTFNRPLQPQLPSVDNPVEVNEELDYSKIDNIEFDGIDHTDHPDYSDTYITRADYNGKEMTEKQLDIINDNSEFVHEKLFEHLY